VEGLSVLRNLAAHSTEDNIGAEPARDYLALADAAPEVLILLPAPEVVARFRRRKYGHSKG
jgi:hypothetical protein